MYLTHNPGGEGLWTDKFCGGGGSTNGIHRFTPGRVGLAINHWREALEVHHKNNRDTVHVLTDISLSNPRSYPRTQFYWGSPDCDWFTEANADATFDMYQLGLWEDGEPIKREALERSRAHPFDCTRWIEFHKYDAWIIENVTRFAKWPLFNSWLKQLESLGYHTKVVSLNSMIADVGVYTDRVPQNRDRLYACGWKKTITRRPKLDIRPRCWCDRCEREVRGIQSWKRKDVRIGKWGLNGQYWYRCPHCKEVARPYVRPASDIVDFSIPIVPIGERERHNLQPLSEKTMARIRKGLLKYGFVDQAVDLSHTHASGARSRPLTMPLFAQTGAATAGVLVVGLSYDGEGKAWPTTQPLPTQTTRQDMGVLAPPGSFLVKFRGSEDGVPHDRPLPTVSAGGIHAGLCVPDEADRRAFLTIYNGEGNTQRLSTPLTAVTTRDRHGLVALPEMTADTLEEVVQGCGFRMLRPMEEIRLACGFLNTYEFSGNDKDDVCMLGNAVSPAAAGVLARELMAICDVA